MNSLCLAPLKGKSPPFEPFFPAASSLVQHRWWQLLKPESQWHFVNPPLITVWMRNTKGGGQEEGESETQAAN